MKKLLIIMALSLFSCGVTQPQINNAIQAACAITPAAQSVSQLVCSLLKSPAREKCLAEKAKADAALSAVVNIGAAVLGACQIK